MNGEGVAMDLRDAFRALYRSPGPTIVAILTLALGVGVNAAVFSVIESILVNPLPYPNAQRPVSIARPGSTGGGRVSAWMANEWMARCPSIATIGLYTDGQLVLTGDGPADLFRGQRVNARSLTPLACGRSWDACSPQMTIARRALTSSF
jgi:hypothetical protein